PAPAPSPQEIRARERRQLHEALSSALDSSNRDMVRVPELQMEYTGSTARIVFRINDNLTRGFIARGAQRDVATLARAAVESGLAFNRLTIVGTFAMVDKFGHSSESDVITVHIDRVTLSRIN